MQRLVKVFDQIRKHVEAQNQRIGTPADLYCGRTVSSSQPPKVLYKTAILKNFGNIHRKHPYWRLFLKKLQTFRIAALLKRDPNTGVFL